MSRVTVKLMHIEIFFCISCISSMYILKIVITETSKLSMFCSVALKTAVTGEFDSRKEVSA